MNLKEANSQINNKNNKPSLSHSNKEQKQCVINLKRYSEEGNDKKLSQLVETESFSGHTLNIALRKLIIKFDCSNEKYLDCIAILLHQNIDINFRDSSDNDSTVLMKICGKGDVDLVRKFLECSDNANKDREDRKIFFDFTAKDSNNLTFIHYIFYSNANECDAIGIFDFFFNDFAEKNPQQKDLFISFLKISDNNGDIPLSICLRKGWYYLSKKCIELTQIAQNINHKKENSIHLGIKGRSLYCLRLSLFYSKSEDLKMKNEEGLTPILLARNKGYTLFMKVISNYENNISNEEFKRDYLTCCNIKSGELLERFKFKQYEVVYNVLNQMKINLSIANEDKISNVSIPLEWNILLTKFNLEREKKSNILIFPYRNEFISFFNKYPNKDDGEFFGEFQPIDVILYNKGVFYWKECEYTKCLEVFTFYIQSILSYNNNCYYKWIVYFNSTLIVIQIFIKLKYYDVALVIIKSIEKFLFKNYSNDRKDDPYPYTEEIKIVFNYLHSIKLFTQYTNFWDESFSYLNLLKEICIKCNDMQRDNNLKEFKKLFDNAENKDALPVFDSMETLYLTLKIRKLFLIVDSNCFNDLILLKQERITDSLLIYYYNLLGILYLKKQKFFSAELQFKHALDICKNELNNKNCDVTLDTIASIKFNIALCLFFEHKFIQARGIFIGLSNIKCMKRNKFLWYRLGLCELEIELSKRKKTQGGYNAIVKDAKGFETAKSRGVNKREPECIIIDLDENSENNDNSNYDTNEDNDYILMQFEREYGNGLTYNNYCNSSTPNATYPNGSLLYTLNKKTSKPLRRFYLHNTKLPQIRKSGNLSSAISSFRRVVLLSKRSALKQLTINTIVSCYCKDKQLPLMNQREEQSNVVLSAYMNLLFCLSLSEEWLEVLYMIKDIERVGIIKSNDILIKIETFRIEALIYLNKAELAVTAASKILERYENDSYRFDLYSRGNFCLYSDIYFKLNLYYGLCLISIKNKQIHQAEEYINSIINYYIQNKESIPSFVSNIGIYINLVKYNNGEEGKEEYLDKALKLIKVRKEKIIINNN